VKKRKSRRIPFAVALIIGICILSVSILFIIQRSKRMDDQHMIVGRWIRPDGGYIIHIIDVLPDGTLDAAYYNPRPIHVAKAEAAKGKDGLEIFIELRDTGYPGATYELLYNPEKDTLIGLYYQPTVEQYFDVIFVRMK